MAYLYEKENHHWVNWNGGSGLIYPFYEYAPGEILIVGVRCQFPQLEEIEIALLDTGAQYSVVGREMYATFSQILQPAGENVKMSTRRGSIKGSLERVEIRLVADLGEDLNLETICFISEEWTGPTVLGFSTLSQMRMALDPFYPNPAAEPGRIFLVVSSVINLASVGKDHLCYFGNEFHYLPKQILLHLGITGVQNEILHLITNKKLCLKNAHPNAQRRRNHRTSPLLRRR